MNTVLVDTLTAGAQTASAAGNDHPLNLLLLSSSLLTDRVFLHTDCLERLSREARVKVWAMSARHAHTREMWGRSNVIAEAFPQVHPYRWFPYNFLRRVNDSVWDFRHYRPSRLSMWQHVRSKTQDIYTRSIRLPAHLLALFKSEAWIEDRLEKLLLGYPRSPESVERLTADRPTLLLTTGPFQFSQPAVVADARRLGIPTLALIPSWDNISTKDRLVFKYDGYIVWSEKTKQELHQFYPGTRRRPVYVVGAPQFDVFYKERFHISRESFCQTYGLRADLPIVVYALGSPNFLQEHHGARAMAERVAGGELGDIQLLIRPHPLHDNGEMNELFREFGPRVMLQQTVAAGSLRTARSQDRDQIVEWVNTFRHADVVVNLSSTVTVDAAICDRPVVNLDYDPEPGQPNQALVKDINHLWTHFKPVAESGGVWLVNNPDEMVEAVRTYLRHPELHREERRWVAGHVCQYLDGQCSQRMAQAILDFAHTRIATPQQA